MSNIENIEPLISETEHQIQSVREQWIYELKDLQESVGHLLKMTQDDDRRRISASYSNIAQLAVRAETKRATLITLMETRTRQDKFSEFANAIK